MFASMLIELSKISYDTVNVLCQRHVRINSFLSHDKLYVERIYADHSVYFTAFCHFSCFVFYVGNIEVGMKLHVVC